VSGTEQQRITDMDRDIVALKVSNAQLAVTVSTLAGQVGELTKTVQDLNNTMHTGRGALLGVMFVAGATGAVVATVFKKLIGVA
jgi:hypothetical protein